MTEIVDAALEPGSSVGAHPSYPDRGGFGRNPIDIDRGELGTSLTEQLRALDRVCRKARTRVASVKAHGALYTEVAKGGAVYETFRDAVRATVGERAALVLPSGCRAMAMVLRDGMTACEEGFCDRMYRADGGLVDRATAGAVLVEPGGRRPRRSAWPGVRWWPQRLGPDPVGGHPVHSRRFSGRGGDRHRRAACARRFGDRRGRARGCVTHSVPAGEVRLLGDRAFLIGVTDAGRRGCWPGS